MPTNASRSPEIVSDSEIDKSPEKHDDSEIWKENVAEKEMAPTVTPSAPISDSSSIRLLRFLSAVLVGFGGISLVDYMFDNSTEQSSRLTAAPKFQLDINTASSSQLQALPEIGPLLAKRIVQDRQENGIFNSIQDIQRVRGFGPATMKQLAPMLTTGSTRNLPIQERQKFDEPLEP